VADNSSGMGFMGFIVGGVVVVVAILAFVIYGGQGTGPSKIVNIEMPRTSVPAR